MTTAIAEKTYPTPAEIHEEGTRVRQIVESYTLCLDATIDDYPIGRADRGKCRLQVERAKGKGYRSVRTTTDKNGRWCKPKKSTFSNDCWVVITGLGGDRDIRWLRCGTSGVYLYSANGASSALIEAPYIGQPCRTERRYTTTTHTLYGGAEVKREEHIIEADPPALCDAYDAWLAEYKEIRQILSNVWERAAITG